MHSTSTAYWENTDPNSFCSLKYLLMAVPPLMKEVVLLWVEISRAHRPVFPGLFPGRVSHSLPRPSPPSWLPGPSQSCSLRWPTPPGSVLSGDVAGSLLRGGPDPARAALHSAGTRGLRQLLLQVGLALLRGRDRPAEHLPPLG